MECSALEELLVATGRAAPRPADAREQAWVRGSWTTMLDNTLYLGLLAALFPRATFRHCRRDLRDVAVSCWMTDFRTIRWANDPAHRRPRLPPPDGPLAAVLPVAVHEVDYEETVTDLPVRSACSRRAFGLGPGMSEFHRTARLVRARQPGRVRQPCSTQTLRWPAGSTTKCCWPGCSRPSTA